LKGVVVVEFQFRGLRDQSLGISDKNKHENNQ
jgi:hypothetical protein